MTGLKVFEITLIKYHKILKLLKTFKYHLELKLCILLKWKFVEAYLRGELSALNFMDHSGKPTENISQ